MCGIENSTEGKPLISVIVPVYNTESYLSECIESVIRQTFADWELILVDDGSSDKSLCICNEYAKKDNRIKVFHKENSGQFETRMLGVKKATGLYCTGLDSDDYYEDNCLETVAKALVNDDADILVWNLKRVENGVVNDDTLKYTEYKKYAPQEYISRIVESTDNSFCNKAFRRQLFNEVDESLFKKEIRVSEDALMVYQLVVASQQIVSINDYLYNYRIHNESISHKYDGNILIGAIKAADVLYVYLVSKDLMNNELEKVFARVHMNIIATLIKESYKCKAITGKQCKTIHSLEMYKKLKKYENREILNNIDIYVAAKLFRYRLYFLLKIMCDPRRYK